MNKISPILVFICIVYSQDIYVDSGMDYEKQYYAKFDRFTKHGGWNNYENASKDEIKLPNNFPSLGSTFTLEAMFYSNDSTSDYHQKIIGNHEIVSVKCAIKMREKLDELNEKWNENEFSRYWKNHGIDKITARTGVHTGGVIAGNIGSDRMLQYSTIGDTVNVASRLEQANKEFSTSILFSHEIYSSLTKDLYDKANYQGEISLKGRDQKTKVYDI